MRSEFRNRWMIAVGALSVQLCLGAGYGWSVFKNPLIASEHWSETSVQLNFTLAFLCFGLGTIAGGIWQDRVGPRRVTSFAGLLFGAGYILAGISTSHHSLRGIYIGYGLLAGLGMGMGYICPVAMLLKWFPDKRGLMTGVAVCGFGFSALIMSPFAAWEIVRLGVPATFWTLGIVYLMVVVGAAQVFCVPPQGWKPVASPRRKPMVDRHVPTVEFTLPEAMRTWQFYLLFFMLFFNLAAGFMVISQASPMAQEMVGMTVLKAADMVGLIAIFNGLGRVSWAMISDHLGRAQVYFVIFATETVMFFFLPHIHSWTLFSIAFSTIGFCFGGGLGTMPSFAADYFGARALGAIYGFILFGANAAGTASPIIIALVHQNLGKYAPATNIVAIAVGCSTLLPLIARRPIRIARVAENALATD